MQSDLAQSKLPSIVMQILGLAYHNYAIAQPLNHHWLLLDIHTMKVTQEKLEQSRIGLQIEVTGDQTTKYYEQADRKSVV